MQKKEIVEKLTLIFRDTFGQPTMDLRDDLTADDVENWDSLTHMLLITKVENQFGFRFKLKDLNKMKQVGDMITLIESKIDSQIL
ncbi:MAG: acyl carrier protein [Mariniphaga sp.]